MSRCLANGIRHGFLLQLISGVAILGEFDASFILFLFEFESNFMYLHFLIIFHLVAVMVHALDGVERTQIGPGWIMQRG